MSSTPKLLITDKINAWINTSIHWTIEMVRRFSKTVSVFLLVFACWIFYWAMIGFSIDTSIRQHIGECEKRLVDVSKSRCVVAFIPIRK